MAEVAGTCNLLPLLLAHHLALLSDPGRGVHRGCPGESPVEGSAKNTDDFQVNRKQLTLPSSLSRLALVIVHSLGPAILASALRRLEKKLEDPDLEISPAARRTLLKVLPFLQSVASGLQKLHTCLFYLQVIPKMTQKMDRIPQGSYYHLAKRLLGIEYVKRVEEDEDESGGAEKNTGPVFRLLGGVAALHLILSALQTLRKPPSSSSSSTSVPLSSSADERRTLGHRCPLCLDALGTCGVRIRSFFVSWKQASIIHLAPKLFGKKPMLGDNSNTLWTSCLLDLPAGRAQSNWRMCCLQVLCPFSLRRFVPSIPWCAQETRGATHCHTLQKLFLCDINFATSEFDI